MAGVKKMFSGKWLNANETHSHFVFRFRLYNFIIKYDAHERVNIKQSVNRTVC